MIIENGTIVLTRFPPMFSSSSPSFKRVIRERRPWLGLRKKGKKLDTIDREKWLRSAPDSSCMEMKTDSFSPPPSPRRILDFRWKKNRGYPWIVTSGSPSSSLNFQPRSPSSELGKGRAGRTERRRSNKEGKRRGGPRLAGNKLP